MRKRLLLLVSLALFVSQAHADPISVIPQPLQMESKVGAFTFQSTTRILSEPRSDLALGAATVLRDRLIACTGWPVAAVDATGLTNDSVLLTTQGADASLGDEGYTLDVATNGITIRAPHPAGLFYGVQSLLQLMPPDVYRSVPTSGVTWSVPAIHISDHPRFRWRGLMLDVSRHFEPKSVVLSVLDQMAVHKLNVFHWHLTDDQGWRIEIKKYPRLTTVGAWRDQPGFNMDPRLSKTFDSDGRYGGFYTQDDIREVVAYAAARHIMVVPEIEMPGHATAALAAYPELAMAGRPFVVEDRPGIFYGVYDPANEKTFTFMQDVLTEVMDLFPSPYIHIGGDEVPKGPWINDPGNVALMQQQHLENAEQLQSYFVGRIGKFLGAHGRHLIGWDEILEGGLVPDSTVMSWRGTKGGLAAATAGHDVVMSPTSNCYLDGEQGIDTEPHERGSLLALQKVYAYEPTPEGLSADKVSHVLGLQGNLWTEYVPNGPWVEYMLWPRATALAEVGWSDPASRSWKDFARRLADDEHRLDAMGVNYRPIVDSELTAAIHLDASGKLSIENPISGSVIRYTVDDTIPTESSPIYSTPMEVPLGWVHVKAGYFRKGIVATPVAAASFLDGRAVTLTSTMRNAWDSRRICFFTPQWGIGPNETVTISFPAGPQKLKQIIVQTGDANSAGSQLQHGVLESSVDGKIFGSGVPFNADGAASLNMTDHPISAFRIRFTGTQVPKPIIRTVQLQ